MKKNYFLLSLFLLCLCNFYACKTSEESKSEETKNEDGELITSATSSDNRLSVNSKENGLFITKNHSSEFTHISIFIENSKGLQTSIEVDEESNEFLYPFVENGKNYKIYMTLMDSDYGNWNQTETVTVTAVGGKGELYTRESLKTSVFRDNFKNAMF